MLLVIDTARSQQTLDLTIPWGEGYRANYVKMGGDNNPRYIASYYAGIVDRSRAIGYRVGHYWVPDARKDPVGAADFYVDNLRGWTKRDFAVLDNESFSGNDPDGSGPLQDSVLYSDEQAAAWVERVKARLGIPGNQVLVYYGLADARGRRHDAVLATGANFIIAAYSYAPFTFAAPSNIPMSRIVGHQTGGKLFGGIATDINSFTDNAFNYDQQTPDLSGEDDMIYISGDSADRHALIGPGYVKRLTTQEERDNAASLGRRLDGNDRQYDVWVALATQGEATGAAAGGFTDEQVDRIIAALPTGALTQADVIEAVKSLKFVATP